MKNFSPNNKIYGLVKILTVAITIISTVGFSPFSATFSDVSAPAVPVARACEEPSICNLTLTKTDSIDPVEPGDELVYHLTLKNIGNGDCTGGGVLIKDIFDQNTTYVSSSKTPEEITSEYIKWNFGTVTPGEIENVDLTVLVSQDTQCGSVLINKAKSWSTQTNWSEFIVQETSVVCPPQPFCGDGNLDQGEECEIGHECECGDGFTCNTQTCLCEQVPPEPYCGDGIKNQLIEQCDGTDWVGAHQACTQDCQLINLPWCGDGVKNDAEECDGTSGVGEHQSCTEQCTLVNLDFCGDNIKNGDEQCDGQSGVLEHYGCTVDCRLEFFPFCGDGVLQPDEQCDDGNIANGDGCSAQCVIEAMCQPGETQTNSNYNSKPQITTIDSSTTNVAYKLCDDAYSGVDVDTANGQPHYIYLTWDNLNPSDYDGFLNFNLSLNHMEYQSTLKVELKNQFGIWVEVCDPAERSSYTVDTCNLAPYSLILKEVSEVELRIVGLMAGACHEYLKCATLEASLYTCEGPQPICGDNVVNQTSEECDDGNVTNGDGCSASCQIELPVCDIDVELVKNGGFESPLIADSQSWSIFIDSVLGGWHVEWASLTPAEYNGYSRPANAYLELQNDLAGWSSQEGNQYAELDSDWDGYGGALNGEPASVKIYQDIQTIPGEKYTVTFWFSPRPNTSLENNRLEFGWNGSVVDNDIEGAGENTNVWTKHTYTLTATSNTTRIQFADLGVPSDATGTFVDNISARCGEIIPQPICGDNVKNQETEQCDGTDGVIEHNTCTAQCTLQYIPYCSDGTVNQTSEQCDDGNLINGDGCSLTCQLEQNEPNCGNGVIETGEVCDNAAQNGVECTPGCGGTCSYCTSQCQLNTRTGGGCGGGGGGGGGDSYYPALAISKFVIEDIANPGETIHYTVILKNNGNAPANNVKLTDTLPAGFTFSDTGLATKEWDLGNIAMGVEKITTYEAFIDQGVVPGDYKNLAAAQATNQGVIYARALTTVLGEVLGERIELPDTGTDPFWFVFAGLSLILVSLIGIYLTDANSKKIIKLQINN